MNTKPIEAGPITEISIDLPVGKIILTAHDNPGVIGQIVGPNAEAFTVHDDGSCLTISSPRKERKAHDITVALPNGVRARLRIGSGSISSDVTLGDVECRSGSGDVTFTEVGSISCAVGSGDVSISTVSGDSAKVTTGSGDVSLGRCEPAVHLRSGSGDISVADLRAALRGVTGSGSFAIDRMEGTADVKSGSGNVEIAIAAELPAWLDLRSGSGQVQVELEDSEQPAEGEPFAAVRARTGSGRIRITRARS